MKVSQLVCVSALLLCGCVSLPKAEESVTLSPTAAAALTGDTKFVDIDSLGIWLAKNGNPALSRATYSALLDKSDKDCEKYMTEVIIYAQKVDSGLTLGSLFLSGAATLITPLRNSHIAAGGATYLSGSKDALSQIVLGGNTTSVLYRAVMAGRSKEKARLLALMADNARLNDVQASLSAYHGMCGPVYGINQIDAAVTEAKNTAEKKGAEEGAQLRQLLRVQ
jgi:hypothetical protein